MAEQSNNGTGSESSAMNASTVCDGLWKRPIRGPQTFSHMQQSTISTPRASSVGRIGMEMEMFAYDAESLIPLGLPSSVFHPSELLKRMSDVVDGARLKVDPSTGVVVGLSFASGANFSLEPGGQVEFSSAPHAGTKGLIEDVVFGLRALEEAAQGQVLFLSHGTNPLAPENMPLLVPKERYQILRRYFLSQSGGRGADMMGHTATVQPNIDIVGDDADWEDAVRLTFALTPAIQSLTRNSSYFAGKRSQFPSERQQIWHCTDRSRSGIPEGIVHSGDVACHYANWARMANVFLVRGLPVEEQPVFGELTFEQFLRNGYKGIFPNLQDWELHLATLFPELRLRGFLEIRNLDAQPFEHLLAGVMLWKGLLLDRTARAEAWSLLSTQSLPQRREQTLERELVQLSIESLRRMEDDCGVAALESARAFWCNPNRSSNSNDVREFVSVHATPHPSQLFTQSLRQAGCSLEQFFGQGRFGKGKR
jgi:glutamate--cysteine ligase